MTSGLPEAIEALDTRHDRRRFSCGDSELGGYLQRFARQHAAAKISRTYVAANGATILGFYSLAMSAIRKDLLPAVYQSRYHNYPLPVARLARLAVDRRYQRQGLCELLLANALSRCLRLSDEIGMVGVVVDAKHERARRYYERFEFERFPDSPLTLWLPTAAIAQL